MRLIAYAIWLVGWPIAINLYRISRNLNPETRIITIENKNLECKAISIWIVIGIGMTFIH